MPSPSQLARLYEAARAAKVAEKSTGCPALLSVCQWILESGWGQHCPGNNWAGIKARPGEPFQTLMTTEYVNGKPVKIPQKFAVFNTVDDCFVRHAQLITTAPVYRPAMAALPDFEKFVKLLAKHYATDVNYAKMILEISNMKQVKQALDAN